MSLGYKALGSFVDSFDHYDTADIGLKYESTSGTSSIGNIGRNSTQGLTGSGGWYIAKEIDDTASGITVRIGMMVNIAHTIPRAGYIVNFSWVGVVCWISAAGSVWINPPFAGGANNAGTKSGVFMFDVWNSLEVDVQVVYGLDIHSNPITTLTGNGVVNGVVIPTMTNVQGGTLNNTPAYVQFGDISGNLTDVTIDDVYINSLIGIPTAGGYTGPQPTFPGYYNGGNATLMTPNAAGTSSQWSNVGGGANFSDTNEIPPDGDTSYVLTDTVGHLDTYGLTAPSGVDSVQIVQVVIDSRIESTARTVQLGFGNASIQKYEDIFDQISDFAAPTTSYKFYTNARTTNTLAGGNVSFTPGASGLTSPGWVSTTAWTPTVLTSLQSAINLFA